MPQVSGLSGVRRGRLAVIHQNRYSIPDERDFPLHGPRIPLSETPLKLHRSHQSAVDIILQHHRKRGLGAR